MVMMRFVQNGRQEEKNKREKKRLSLQDREKYVHKKKAQRV